MFATKLFFAAFSAISAFYFASALPTSLAPRADWKTELGWDGKVTSPAELDPKNAVEATPSKRALPGGVFFCTDKDYKGKCVYVNQFNSGQCVGVGPDFNDDVSSFGPDQGLTCTIYRQVFDGHERISV
ncbi:hypothetical protein FRC12_012183 [Ceratobasidium sp. 428]|nr:hypothetical protein FRC12_012183 [Ceratobasidium sp. 428]